MKLFIYIVIGIVVVAIITGFFVVGSPHNERLRKYDERRVSDLQFLQSEIINFWQQKGVLPKTSGDLQDDIRGISVPVDPETTAPYEYRVKNQNQFLLCANFNLNTLTPDPEMRNIGILRPQQLEQYPFGSTDWRHDRGRVCFTRVIHKNFYKPVPLRQ